MSRLEKAYFVKSWCKWKNVNVHVYLSPFSISWIFSECKKLVSWLKVARFYEAREYVTWTSYRLNKLYPICKIWYKFCTIWDFLDMVLYMSSLILYWLESSFLMFGKHSLKNYAYGLNTEIYRIPHAQVFVCCWE